MSAQDTIESVTSRLFLLPMPRPWGEVTSQYLVVTELVTSSGASGTGFSWTVRAGAQAVKAMVDADCAPAVIGLPAVPEAVWDRLWWRLRESGGGVTTLAMAAIDIALWDLIGQSLGVSVTGLLGGYADRMRVAHMVGFAAPGEMADEALRIREQHGITTFKVKVGRRPVQLDITACRALREALGEDAELYIDGNRGWTAAESARALDQLADVGLLFAEELCRADDIVGRRWLVQHAAIPIYADESVSRPAEVTREILGGSATGVSINDLVPDKTSGA